MKKRNDNIGASRPRLFATTNKKICSKSNGIEYYFDCTKCPQQSLKYKAYINFYFKSGQDLKKFLDKIESYVNKNYGSLLNSGLFYDPPLGEKQCSITLYLRNTASYNPSLKMGEKANQTIKQMVTDGILSSSILEQLKEIGIEIKDDAPSNSM